MSRESKDTSPSETWARFRFAVIGPLLAAPPKPGELQQALRDLAKRTWKHPVTGAPTTFGASTLERWYYAVRDHGDPMSRLQRTPRKDAGRWIAISQKQQELLRAQHAAHPKWTYQLHADNLAALCRRDKQIGEAPSYSSVRRFMKSGGLLPRRGRHRHARAGKDSTFEEREVRSFEIEHVNGLWHLDFHHGKKKVLTSDGRWVTPILLGVLDDCSRLCCHAQWYLDENTEALVHGFCQAIQKRELPVNAGRKVRRSPPVAAPVEKCGTL
jgi:putative transposase